MFELFGFLAEELREVHAFALGVASGLRGFQLSTLLEQLANLLGRERPAALAPGTPARFHLDVLVGLAFAVARVSAFVVTVGLRTQSFGSTDEVVAHQFGGVAERIVLTRLARRGHQTLEPSVSLAGLESALRRGGAGLAKRCEKFRRPSNKCIDSRVLS